LIKAICKSLGSADSLSSPTYAIVNEYASPAGKLYHFDLYRIKNEDELYDLGFEEYLSNGNYCFIEWPEVAQNFINQPFTGIFFGAEEKLRKIIVENRK
jgi:tRNA threonylcarbamoyladenosine biosynthesis protein TsaE